MPRERGSASVGLPQAASDTASLLRRARAGEATALDALVRRYLPRLRRLAHARLPRWVRRIADTADVVQDALMRTIGRLDTVDVCASGAFGAYLGEAVRNRIRDEHRRFSRQGRSEGIPASLPDRGAPPDAVAIAHELGARYREALSRLPAADRYLIVGHVELDYNHDQLGQMTGRSRNAARMALQRALHRLAAEMAR